MRSRITAVAASVLALATMACARADASAANDADTAAAVPVVIETVTPSTRAWSTTASGIVQANTSVDVAFQVPGKVVAVGPDEGQSVRAGQEIASIDPTDYRLAVEQASAQADRAARDRDRNQPLLASGGIAPADMDHLESGARQSAAAADLAKKRLADTHLTAPISGIIARRAVEVGATVSPGQPAFTIVDLDPVRVRIGVPEADVGHVTEGAPATVHIPALDASFVGRVSLIGVVADPTTRSYTVEVSVPNPARRLRAGMVAEATITTGQKTTATMVPASAVLHDGGVNGTTIVYLLDRDDARVHARRVTTGAAHGDSLEISSGIAANDQVVVAGQQRLREGARVELVNDRGTRGLEANPSNPSSPRALQPSSASSPSSRGSNR
ncbi:MAG TPA: efflux RND transporter periplasmic adaptor subunit [Gemmatimonadaceae bacterium]|nr:efflux RND transporter periplasmic adaptor subunit [Gemmatimonadaceae bacterium]